MYKLSEQGAVFAVISKIQLAVCGIALGNREYVECAESTE